MKNIFSLSVRILFLFIVLAVPGCELFEYTPGGNLTFSGTNNVGGIYSVSRVEVGISGGGDDVSLKESSVFTSTNRAYTTFTGLAEGEYSIGVDVFDGDTLLTHNGDTVFLPSGNNLQIEYSIENIDSSASVVFQGTGAISGEQTTLEITAGGSALVFERPSWNDTVNSGYILSFASGVFDSARNIRIIYPDNQSITMNQSRSVLNASLFISEGSYIQAHRIDYYETGAYTIEVEDENGLYVSDSEFLSLVWGEEQVPALTGSPAAFSLTSPPNNYDWVLSSNEGAGTLICLVINKDDSGTVGTAQWVDMPGNSGTFSLDSGDLHDGDGWIILITLDARITGTDVFNSITDFKPNNLPAQITGIADVNFNGIGILAESITIMP